VTLAVRRNDGLDLEKHFVWVFDFYIIGKKSKQKPFQGPINNGGDVKSCPVLLSSSQLPNNAEKSAVIRIAKAASFFKILRVTEE
jgi:hypothetical protein